MRKMVLAATAMMVAGCQTMGQQQVDPSLQNTPIKLTEEQGYRVRQGVLAVLKDPNSAMFGGARAGITSKGVIMVCGYVNAKNSFGGYTGMKPFTGSMMSAGGPFIVAGIGGTEVETNALLSTCSLTGLPIG